MVCEHLRKKVMNGMKCTYEHKEYKNMQDLIYAYAKLLNMVKYNDVPQPQGVLDALYGLENALEELDDDFQEDPANFTMPGYDVVRVKTRWTRWNKKCLSDYNVDLSMLPAFKDSVF